MDLTIQLNDACNRLRIIINNEQNAERCKQRWVEMSLTSTQSKKLKKEANYVDKKTQR